MANRKIWAEKRFEINRQGDHRNIVIQMGNKNWCVLINPPKNLNHDMVREFYANALPSEGNPFTFTTMIKGRTIHFNMDMLSTSTWKTLWSCDRMSHVIINNL